MVGVDVEEAALPPSVSPRILDDPLVRGAAGDFGVCAPAHDFYCVSACHVSARLLVDPVGVAEEVVLDGEGCLDRTVGQDLLLDVVDAGDVLLAARHHLEHVRQRVVGDGGGGAHTCTGAGGVGLGVLLRRVRGQEGLWDADVVGHTV